MKKRKQNYLSHIGSIVCLLICIHYIVISLKVMEKKTILSANQYTKVLVPASSYKLEKDPRLLIPFTSGDKIGRVSSSMFQY